MPKPLLRLCQTVTLGFHALWQRYPNKSAKKDAEKAFGQVVVTSEIEQAIHEALDWQIIHWASLGWYHPPYLATYLRQERWMDEKPATKTPGQNTELPDWKRRALFHVK